MPDSEDAAVHAVQPSDLDPLVNSLPAESDRDKLPQRDEAVLLGRELRDLLIAMPRSSPVNLFSTSIDLSDHVPHTPPQQLVPPAWPGSCVVNRWLTNVDLSGKAKARGLLDRGG